MSSTPKAPDLTPSDLVVLAVVADTPCHGYDLWKRLEGANVGDWAPVSKPQIYYSLKKLSSLALISEQQLDSKSAGPKRDIYKATRKGRSALRKNLAKSYWAENRDPPPFITWAALSLVLPKEERLAQIQRRREFLEQEVQREIDTLKELEPHQEESANLARDLIDFVLDQFAAELAWLDRFEKNTRSKNR